MMTCSKCGEEMVLLREYGYLEAFFWYCECCHCTCNSKQPDKDCVGCEHECDTKWDECIDCIYGDQ